ncbi:MAG: hypothetical protein AAF409_10135 [Pseudomonadota bacterium]
MTMKNKTPCDLSDDDLDGDLTLSAGTGLQMNGWLEAAQAGMMDAVMSPRDAASGMPTGKRRHKPFTS